MLDSLIWAAVIPAYLAALNADREAELAALDARLDRERERAIKRATSIEVEARWVDDVAGLLEAP